MRKQSQKTAARLNRTAVLRFGFLRSGADLGGFRLHGFFLLRDAGGEGGSGDFFVRFGEPSLPQANQ